MFDPLMLSLLIERMCGEPFMVLSRGGLRIIPDACLGNVLWLPSFTGLWCALGGSL